MKALATRPVLPALVWVACGVFSGVIIAEELSWRRLNGGTVPLTSWAALAVACAVALIAWLSFSAGHNARRGISAVVMCALGASIGCATGLASWAQWHDARKALESPHSTLVGTVDRDPQPGAYGWSVMVRPQTPNGCQIRVLLDGGGVEPPECARTVRLQGRVSVIDPAEEWARRAHRRGEVGSAKVRALETGRWADTPQGWVGPLRSRLRRVIGQVRGDGGDLLQGILLGDRSRLNGTAVEADLRVCGLSHLLAVSGTHLGIVSLIVTWAATRSRRGVRFRVCAVALAAIVYVVMTGVQPSALRALVMGFVAGLARLTGRRSDGIAALALVAAVMLVWRPTISFDAGFQLSVAAVGGLLLFAGLAESWGTAAFGRKARPLVGPLGMTLVAQAATLPVALPLFGMISIIAPVANIVAVPLVTVALAVGLCAGVVGAFTMTAGAALARLAALPLAAVARAASALGSLPGSALGVSVSGPWLGVAALAAGAALWAWWPLPRDRRTALGVVATALLALLVISVGMPWSPQATITVLDVGQGDAILVRDGWHAVLVDTGPEPDRLREALTHEGIRRLDALILTHDHADHTGGIDGLVGLTSVSGIFVPDVAEEEAFEAVRRSSARIGGGDRDGVRIRTLRAGNGFVVGSIKLDVLWPPGPDPGLSTNDTSVVLEVTRGQFTALLTGDAEGPAWNSLERRGRLHRIDMLKVPHHGSANGMTARALELWSPRLSVISVGQPNDFAHPAQETLGLLASARTPVLRTDENGRVCVQLTDADFKAMVDRRQHAPAACATIDRPQRFIVTTSRPTLTPGDHERQRPQRPEACLSHLRPGGTASGAGRRTAEEEALSHRRPRLQPRCFRRGAEFGRRSALCSQHPAVHVRAPPCHRAQGRPHGDRGSGSHRRLCERPQPAHHARAYGREDRAQHAHLQGR